jgi:magnesium-protoporphyrin IX monomethyl ester (oxidative) cyclase
MYVRDHARPEFHKAIGIDPTDYDYRVFRLTSEISQQVFPLTLDIDHPRFRAGMEKLRRVNEKLEAAADVPGFVGRMKRLAFGASAGLTFLSMYVIPAKKHELPQQIRLAPVW